MWASEPEREWTAGAVVERAAGGPFRPVAVAKWGFLGGAAGVAVWGVLESRRADDAYEALEARCAADEAACAARLASGAYADAGLEAAYGDVLAADRRAGRALLAAEVAFAASVVLFVLDLRNAGAPEDIPYEPRLRTGRMEDGGVRLSLHLRLPHR
ncbi:MAG: hypothetical protein WEB88_14095 [Gemmatimonadota bacterium]